jgi:hypothetical protein
MNPEWRTHVDGGGWSPFTDLIEYYEGGGFEDEYNRATNSGRSGANYGAKLTPSRRRTWQVTELQLVLVAINRDKERFEIMAQVSPITGVRAPYFLRANRGRTLKGVNPMRTSLQLSIIRDFDTLKLVGSVTHKTNGVAAKGILQTGLRNDFVNRGRLARGRTGVVCNIWGSIDQVKNTFIQRHTENVRVVIDINEWWLQFGTQCFNRFDVGVKAFVSTGGAVFANVKPYITTILPLTVVSKIMMRRPMSADFIRRIQQVQGQDDVVCGRNHITTKLRAGWINIFSLDLAMNGMPPADTWAFVHGEHTLIQGQYLNTMGDVKTPQLGDASTEWPSWVNSSETITNDEMYNISWKHRVRIHEMMMNSRVRVELIVGRFEGHDVHDVAPRDLSADLFLRLRGDFIRCLLFQARNRSVDPLRQGQLCCTWWEPIIWRAHAGRRPVDVQAVINARTEVHDDRDARLAERYEERINRAGEEYRNSSQSRITHEQRWDAGRAVIIDRNAPLRYRTCWAAGGAIREHPSAWLHPPWSPIHAWDRPKFEWTIFPHSFRQKFRAFMMDNVEDNPACSRERAGIRTTMFYERVWSCVRDSTRRGRAMTDSTIITEYVEEVIRSTTWWFQSGRCRQGWCEEDSFPTTDAISDEPPLVRPTAPRSAARAATPAARGGRQTSTPSVRRWSEAGSVTLSARASSTTSARGSRWYSGQRDRDAHAEDTPMATPSVPPTAGQATTPSTPATPGLAANLVAREDLPTNAADRPT